MTQLDMTPDEMVRATRENLFTEDLLQRLAAVFPTWRLLAEAKPVSPDTVASAVNRPIDQVRADLSRVEETGLFGYDEQGDVVDFFGLQLSPTRHRLDIDGQQLFAG